MGTALRGGGTGPAFPPPALAVWAGRGQLRGQAGLWAAALEARGPGRRARVDG